MGYNARLSWQLCVRHNAHPVLTDSLILSGMRRPFFLRRLTDQTLQFRGPVNTNHREVRWNRQLFTRVDELLSPRSRLHIWPHSFVPTSCPFGRCGLAQVSGQDDHQSLWSWVSDRQKTASRSHLAEFSLDPVGGSSFPGPCKGLRPKFRKQRQ